MRQVLHSALGAACAVGAFLAGVGLVRAADPGPAFGAGKADAAPAEALSGDAGAPIAPAASEASKDGGASEPAAMQPATGDAGRAELAEPPKAEVAAMPAPPSAPAKPPPPPAREAPKPPKKSPGLMLGGSAAALAGAAAMGVGIYYLHVDGRPLCRPGEIAPCDFQRDTRTFGDAMLAGGSGVFLLGAAAFFWGFYSDDTGVAVAPTGMVVTRRF
jgi:hypothetical protein